MTRLQAWHAAGHYYQHRNHQVFYRDEGQGEVLLLIHGFPTASWDWWKVWAELIKHYRVIAPDMMGFGFSAKPVKYKYSIQDQADLHEGLLRSLGVSQCRVLAHDYGDTVAQELLARQIDESAAVTLESVCFLNGGLFPGNHKPRLIQKLLASPLGFVIGRFLTKNKLRTNFNAIFGPKTQPTEQEIDEFWALNTYNNGPAIVHKLIRYMHERVQHRKRWLNGLQESKTPLRLIDGGFDPISGRHMASKYQEVVPDADVVVLEKIGHYPQLEAPVEVLEFFLDFNKVELS